MRLQFLNDDGSVQETVDVQKLDDGRFTWTAADGITDFATEDEIAQDRWIRLVP